MHAVGVLEAKTRLSALLDEVEAGGEVLVTRHGRPVARLIPADRPRPPRRLDGPALAAQSDALRRRLAAAGEDEKPLLWQDLKTIARR